jgi:hypothetical protein
MICSLNILFNHPVSEATPNSKITGAYSVTFSIPLTTLQRHNTENSKQIFPERELRGLIPNFHIHVSLRYFYIPSIGRPILLQENMWSDSGNRSQTHECGNWDWSRTIPFLGIHKWDFRCSVDSEVKKWKTLYYTGRKETLYLTLDFMGSLRP